MDKTNTPNSLNRIWGLLKDFLGNKLEYARLSGAEKTTVMLSGIALVLAVFIYALLIALLILFRKPLIQDPIARFVSKIFL